MRVESHVVRQGQNILLGIAMENVVLDVVTTDALLTEALRLLESAHQGLASCRLGSFGNHSVTLNFHQDQGVSVFVDGPEFTSARNQSFGLWLQIEEVQGLLAAALQESSANG